jgi:enterochelin esterase-like enzyme
MCPQTYNETMEEEEESWGMFPNSQHFGGKGGVLVFQDGTRANSQVRVQNVINPHNQEKKVVNVSLVEVVKQT